MKSESKFAAKAHVTGPQMRRGGLNAPMNAPAWSWWTNATAFYAQAKAEAERMRNSKIHHQIQGFRIVGWYEA